MSGYDGFRQVGQFSTDDPLMDRLRIEAELGPEADGEQYEAEQDHEELEFDFGEEPSEKTYVCATCKACGLVDWLSYTEGNDQSKEAAKNLLKDRHGNCPGQLKFEG